MLASTLSEAMREPPPLPPSSPPARALLGHMSTMALQTLLDSASLAKLPAVLELLALPTLDSQLKALAINAETQDKGFGNC
jgi:hypothetical protein